ncbi:MAG: NUDIX domain-containing protein [Bacillota bacterium]|nr:NUDIX domain-containing protein [Bacillota bacterium]
MAQGRREVSAGVAVIDGEQVLLIYHRRGEWLMPKGHVEPGETPAQAARREVGEETGISVRLLGEVGRTEYDFDPPGEEGRRFKQVYWFVGTPEGKVAADPSPHRAEGIEAAVWLPRAEALARLTFPADRQILARALELYDRQGKV